MEFVAALLNLSDQYGLTPVLAIASLVGGFFLLRGIVSTFNKVWITKTDARSHAERAEADRQSSLVGVIREVIEQNREDMIDSRADRREQLAAIRDSNARMEGFTLGMGDHTKSIRALSTHIHEVTEIMPGMQTDLKDMSLRTADLPSKVTSALDERLTPMLTLMMGMNAQMNAVAAVLQANGQNVEALIAEVKKSNDLTARVVSEFALWKDILFDKDDRFYEVLTKLFPTEKEKIP